MIINILAWFTLVLLLIKTAVSLINCFSRLHLDRKYHKNNYKISVLIPARNEEENLPSLLADITKQDYSNFEVLVYNDHSTDKTPEIIEKFQAEDSRIVTVPSKELPKGWLGKTFACHQLAMHAKGDYMLFLDADVRISPDLLQKSLYFMRKCQLSLLSVFPHQFMKTTGEKLTVPLMNWILLSLLPMILIRKSSRTSLAAANGQFMMFEKENYLANNWHEQVRDNLVEDIEICRKMKSKEYQVATLLGNNDVMCRMYNSYYQGLNGFAKNVVEFFGGSVITTFLYALLTVTGFIFIFLNWGWSMLILFVGFVILNRIFVSLASRQSVIMNLILHIPQMFSFLLIVIKGIQVQRTGKYVWKGRNIGG